MTEYINEVVNPDKPGSFMKDTKENILHDLEHYTLDPVFEEYGNFVYKPTWMNKEAEERYDKGCTIICGNFETYSHAFRVYTDDEELIKEFTEAIRKNQSTEEYKAAKKRLEERRQMEHEELVTRLERNKRR